MMMLCLLLSSALPVRAQVQGMPRTRFVGGGLPIVFEPAVPEQDSSVTMIGRLPAVTVEFRRSSIGIHSTRKETGGFGIEFDGARGTLPRGGDLEQSQSNYLLGDDPAQWRTHVSNYKKVVYSNLYTGIDAVFYGNGTHLEHDFIVKPGADYRKIRMRFSDGPRIHLSKDGALVIALAGDSLRMDAPSIYQNLNGKRHRRSGRFRVLPNGDVSFVVDSYDPHFDLVIDPVLIFSSYLSPLGADGNGIATDAAGNSYVTGYATLGYPVTTGAFSGCATCTAGNVVTFVSKLSADGSNLIYSTVLGGNNFAQPTGIVVDANGNAIVSGLTGATDFPTKSGQAILPQGNNTVGFLVSLAPDGASLNYGTLLGPSPTAPTDAMTYATAVAVDGSGDAYVTGETGEGFFVSTGALNQEVKVGESYTGSNVYLAKFDPTGKLLYSAVLGTADPQNPGGGPIGASAIAVDTAGNAYVTGQAGTLWPITSGAYLNQIAGSMPYATPFVMKVAPDAKSVIYSTYLDYAYVMSGIAVLANGDVIVTGNEAGASYPTTSDAYESNNGSATSFLTQLNSNGSALVYSTMICGGPCTVNGMALDPNGNIWLAAQTNNAGFPLLTPLQSAFPANQQVPAAGSVLIEFDPTGQILKFATFLGGIAQGYASSVATDANHRVHVSGAAAYGMYTTSGVYAGSVPMPGPGITSTYAYVAVVDPTVPSPGLCVSPNTGATFGAVPLSTTADVNLTITSCGGEPLSISGASTSSSDFSILASQTNCVGTLPIGQSCTLAVQFTPSVAGIESSILTIDSNSPIPVELNLNGTGVNVPIITLSATSITFGPQLVGTESTPQTITITNTGSAPLNGISFGIAATYEPIFPLISTCGASLSPGASCTFSVAFKPASTGTTATTLAIGNNSGLPSQQLSLSGTSPQSPFLVGTQTGGSISSTVTAGNTATFALKITPVAGYSGSVSLACSSLPANATCAFVPSIIALSGGATANFTLSILTELTQAASMQSALGFGVVLAGTLVFFPSKRKRKGIAALICFGALLVITSISSCGGGSSGASNPQAAKVAPGTYTINVVASDGSGNQVTQSITLIVQ
jgi:hypothetical protein